MPQDKCKNPPAGPTPPAPTPGPPGDARLPILGHESVLRRLQTYHRQRWRGGTMLWAGPPAVGKKTLALRFAQGYLCEKGTFLGCGTCRACRLIDHGQHPDVLVFTVEPGQNHSIEDVWRFQHQVALKPWHGDVKFFLWDDAERMRQEAANAMLKTLEEPPEDTITILITSQVYRILPTIRSRAQILRFGPVREDVLLSHLMRQGEWTEAEARWVIRWGQGRPGWVLQPRSFWEFHKRLRRAVLDWFQQWLPQPQEAWWRYMEMDLRPLTGLAREIFQITGGIYTADGWVWNRWWVQQVVWHGLMILRDLYWLRLGLRSLIVNVDVIGTLERMAAWVDPTWVEGRIETWLSFLHDVAVYHFGGAWQVPGRLTV